MFGKRLKKKSKRDILNEFAGLNKVVEHNVSLVVRDGILESKSIVLSNAGDRLPQFSVSVAIQRRTEISQKLATKENTSNALNQFLTEEDTNKATLNLDEEEIIVGPNEANVDNGETLVSESPIVENGI